MVEDSDCGFRFGLWSEIEIVGTLKFLMNATIDTLPNLFTSRHGRNPQVMPASCAEVGKQPTRSALNFVRYTWRHDTILSYIISCIDTSKVTIHSDLLGHQAAGGSTIPPNITITNLRPDIVLVDREAKHLELFELTMPGKGWIDEHHKQKSDNIL